MNVAALLSGGKDSMYALAQAQETHEPVCICALETENPASFMFHHPNTHLLPAIADLLDLPLLQQETAGEKERELDDLKTILERAQKAYDIDGVVTGAIASTYQKDRVERVCEELSLESVAPLWHRDPEEMWEEMLEKGWNVVVTAVAAGGLGREWLGRTIDRAALKELKSVRAERGVHLSGEGGEFETLVLDCPLYTGKIVIEEEETEWDGTRGTLHITAFTTREK